MALEKIIETSNVLQSKVQLTEEQKVMLEMSDADIQNDRIIDQQSLHKEELEWLKKE